MGKEEGMSALVHRQQHGCRCPRIWGWDGAGTIAGAVTADYRRLVDLFGLEPPGVPFTVYIEPGVGSTAHHHGPTTTFFIGAEDPSGACVTTAVMIERFAAAAGTGWEARATNGTALRHALVAAWHPELAPLMQGLIHGWWCHGAVDYLSTNDAAPPYLDATGCGLLFLAYLHDGLGHTWPAIVQTGGPTLASMYAALTGADASHAYAAFMQALTPYVDGAGRLRLPAHGNPWRAEQSTDLQCADP